MFLHIKCVPTYALVYHDANVLVQSLLLAKPANIPDGLLYRVSVCVCRCVYSCVCVCVCVCMFIPVWVCVCVCVCVLTCVDVDASLEACEKLLPFQKVTHIRGLRPVMPTR